MSDCCETNDNQCRAGIMAEAFDGNRIAISEEGNVAVLNRRENCIELYGKRILDTADPQWMARQLRAGLTRPYDVCFAPNDNLVVSDTGDSSAKIFNLEEDQKQMNHTLIGHDSSDKLVIQDFKGLNMELTSSVHSTFKTFCNPQNIVIGPGPLSQLFVSCGTEIILINMDWNKFVPTSYFSICSPMDWCLVQCEKSLVCDNVSAVQDHKVNHKVGGFNPLAITEAQFCGLFYHVTETSRAGFACRQSSECNVGKRGGKKKFAETVVIYVRVMDIDGRLIFHARYGSCYSMLRRCTCKHNPCRIFYAGG